MSELPGWVPILIAYERPSDMVRSSSDFSHENSTATFPSITFSKGSDSILLTCGGDGGLFLV